jgi:hypothetical protein
MDPNVDNGALPMSLTLVKKNVFDDFVHASRNGCMWLNGIPLSSVKYLEARMMIQGSTPDIFIASGKSYQAMSPGQQAFAVGATYGVITGAVGTAALLLTPAGPLVGVAAIAAAFGAPSFTGPRVCTLVIANGLSGSLTRSDLTFDCGLETHYPAVVDPKDITKFEQTHVISGEVTLPMSPPVSLYGVGFYRFENKRALGIGFYGTGGAIAFTSDDPRTQGAVMAVAWLVPETGARGFAVTSDLSRYASLSDFYYKTADLRKETPSDDGDFYSVHGAFWDRESDSDDLVLTVSVGHGKK